MKYLALVCLAIFSLLTTAGASATMETFNAPPGQRGGILNGFTLSSNIYFHAGGRPYLEFFDQAHSITANGTFDFNNIDFNFFPWDGETAGSGPQLHLQLLGVSNNVLLDAFVTLPTDGSWFTYSNYVQDVHQILFTPTNGFWPSFDNLVYNNDVPEPASLALFGLGIIGLAATRRLKK